MPERLSTDGRHAVIGVALVVGLVLLVALAIGARHPGLVLVLLIGVAVCVTGVRAAFPAFPTLWITFGICTPLYSAFFASALSAQFRQVEPLAIHTAYLLPLAAFVGALFARRGAVGARLAAIRPGHRPALGSAFAWLGLSFAVGGVARVALPGNAGSDLQTLALLGTMASIAGLVFWFAPAISVLLTETGLLFHAFVTRMVRRVVPIFSFVVVFLFVAVVFATLYAVLDRFSGTANFSVSGEKLLLDFPQALFFSLVTLSTIGYGDITPVTHVARMIVVGEIIFGVVLMLFAFSEIAAYDPDVQERSKDAP